MERAAGGGLCFLHWILRQEVRHLSVESGTGQSFLDVVAFEIDIGIDFVRQSVVTLILFEANVVRGGANPNHAAFYGERSFPDAQVIAGSHHGDGFGMSPAVILLTTEKI